ncbi:hypothetical protein RIF29_05401 [Crotalaria pallida]|uniref:Uncharacterized protein n=1 Tax=Crotalaria pallida TaxID=3830 RepID=A0AAN9P9R5_CROPI
MDVQLNSANIEVSSIISPRISFSHDISQSDIIPVEKHPLGSSNSSGLNSNIDFDFCVSESFELVSSSADELFLDGRILPTEIKRSKSAPLKKSGQLLAPHPPLFPPSYNNNASSSSCSKNLKKESHKELKYLKDDGEAVCDKQSSSKSFWSFKRSSSCGSGYGRSLSLCSFPLLPRSNSTGSNASVIKRRQLSKEGTNIKQNSQKHSSTRFYPSMPKNYQRPPLNKSQGYYGNNVRVSPVLNVASANLFGLGSIFSNSRDKSKK